MKKNYYFIIEKKVYSEITENKICRARNSEQNEVLLLNKYKKPLSRHHMFQNCAEKRKYKKAFNEWIDLFNIKSHISFWIIVIKLLHWNTPLLNLK